MDLRYPCMLDNALQSGQPFAVVTVVETAGSGPQKTGARLVMLADGSFSGTVGGGAIDHRLLELASLAIADGRSQLVRLDLKKDVSMACGGAMTAFVEPVHPRQRVVVFGGGHVCRALAPVLVGVDFALTVVDDREEWTDPADFPEGVKVVQQGFVEYCESHGAWDSDFALVMTRGHSFDFEILHWLVSHRPAYLGILASKTKAAEFCQRLLQEGTTQQQLDEVYMPVGMPIGSVTPAEIGISITAQLIRVRKDRAKKNS